MKTSTLLSALCLTLVASCDTPAGAPPPSSPVAPAPAAAGVERFGAAIQAGEATPLATVLAKPDAFADQTVLVDGHVRRACLKKGCWMELAPSAAAEGQGCRVTFKDYGFFVPLDSAGATARVEGVVQVRTVPKDEVEHMVAEGATFETRFADGSARELRIVANGVELSGRGG